MNIFVFDIETIPDIEFGKRLHDLGDLDDAEVGKAMFAIRKQETDGSEFLPHYLHQIVAISAVLLTGDKLKVWSLGTKDSPESELLERFFEGIERYAPTLVTWNGSGFDLPVIHYRALKHGIQAPRYWDTGDSDNAFKWNNYLNRYHERHTDLMDVLARFQGRANAPLDKIASMLGFPGKMGMDGSKVWGHYLDGDIEGIRNYCETDVLNTYLVFLRFEYIRGRLQKTRYEQLLEQVKELLREQEKPHMTEFLEAWDSNILHIT